MKEKTALDLSKTMNIDLKHLGNIWNEFNNKQNSDTDTEKLFKFLNEKLNSNERNYLIYLGLNTISEGFVSCLSILSNYKKD